MNVFHDIEARVRKVLLKLQEQGVLAQDAKLDAIVVEPPRDVAHGDMATNAAMVLARAAGMSPRDLAQHIAEGLMVYDDIEKADIAGAGFVNLTLAPQFWQGQLKEIAARGASYGQREKRDTKINVEYVSANPTGPMHVGHARGAVFGDVLARLLECDGYAVTREYYINDAGGQIDMLMKSTWTWTIYREVRTELRQKLMNLIYQSLPHKLRKEVLEITYETKQENLHRREEQRKNKNIGVKPQSISLYITSDRDELRSSFFKYFEKIKGEYSSFYESYLYIEKEYLSLNKSIARYRGRFTRHIRESLKKNYSDQIDIEKQNIIKTLASTIMRDSHDSEMSVMNSRNFALEPDFHADYGMAGIRDNEVRSLVSNTISKEIKHDLNALNYAEDLISTIQKNGIGKFVLDRIMDKTKDDLATLGIKHDTFTSEQALHNAGAVHAALQTLTDKGLIYEGILEAPKGKAPPDDWEERPQTLFRATQFGDDVDRPLKKSNGAWTYFAADIAYHFDKYQRGYKQMVNVWGADHIGYIARMQAALAATTDNKAQLDVRVCNLVKLKRGGEPVKMSKRSGKYITLREVVDEVGKDAVRFMMLTRKNDAPLDFDFDLVKEQSRDNPVFYVQYAHARIFSVLAKAQLQPDYEAVSHLRDEAELALIRKLATYPRVLAAAAEAREPHRIAFYLTELAAVFHALWNKGKDDPQLRFIREDDASTSRARLALLAATQQVLVCGMDVIGIEPQDEMR